MHRGKRQSISRICKYFIDAANTKGAVGIRQLFSFVENALGAIDHSVALALWKLDKKRMSSIISLKKPNLSGVMEVSNTIDFLYLEPCPQIWGISIQSKKAKVFAQTLNHFLPRHQVRCLKFKELSRVEYIEERILPILRNVRYFSGEGTLETIEIVFSDESFRQQIQAISALVAIQLSEMPIFIEHSLRVEERGPQIATVYSKNY